MGNRAVIELEGSGKGIYMHWNGGKDTIDPLLEVAKEYEIQKEGGNVFLMFKLSQIISNAFGETKVSSIDMLDCDNYDNGVYVINSDLEIVDRKFTRHPEQNHWDFDGMKEFIEKANYGFFV